MDPGRACTRRRSRGPGQTARARCCYLSTLIPHSSVPGWPVRRAPPSYRDGEPQPAPEPRRATSATHVARRTGMTEPASPGARMREPPPSPWPGRDARTAQLMVEPMSVSGPAPRPLPQQPPSPATEPVPSDSALRRALARARDGKTLDAGEAATLLHPRGGQLTDLLGYASRTRDAGLERAGRPGVITYSRKVFLPLTRLCRDRCGYCTFATVPGRLDSPYLSPDEVLAIARDGAALGCKEALFTLGDRPEDRWHQAREWLDANGYDDTLSYVRAMAIRVLEETGLLPHLNPGVLTWRDFQRLKPVAPSMGMMLETTAARLFTERGGPHYGSPDKDPAVRLRVLEDAGRCSVPVTTGILIGIGETRAKPPEC